MPGAANRSPMLLKSVLHILISALYAAWTLAFDAATSCELNSIRVGGAGVAKLAEAGTMDEPAARANATTVPLIAVIGFIIGTILPRPDTLGARSGAVTPSAAARLGGQALDTTQQEPIRASLCRPAPHARARRASSGSPPRQACLGARRRSEEHTSELQSPCNLV